MPKNKHKNKKSKSDAAPESTTAHDTVAAATEAAKADAKAEKLAAKQAKAAEKAAAKAAEKEARKAAAKADKAAAKADKAAAKADKAAAKADARDSKAVARDSKADTRDSKAEPADATPAFKHVRRKKLASGKGPTPQEIGESLVALFNAGKSEEAESTWYHRKIESIEDDGSVFEGWKGVLEKGKWWKENFTVLSMHAKGPYVCSTGFAVVYSGRVRMTDGTEVDSQECGVYTVEKGRIVREQFMRAMF